MLHKCKKSGECSCLPRMRVSKYLAITAVRLEIEQCSKAGLSMVGIVVSAIDGDVVSNIKVIRVPLIRILQ